MSTRRTTLIAALALILGLGLGLLINLGTLHDTRPPPTVVGGDGVPAASANQSTPDSNDQPRIMDPPPASVQSAVESNGDVDTALATLAQSYHEMVRSPRDADLATGGSHVLRGTVTSREGLPIEGARIELAPQDSAYTKALRRRVWDESRDVSERIADYVEYLAARNVSKRQTMTDHFGRFQFPNVADIQFQITASAPAYRTERRLNVSVHTDFAVSLAPEGVASLRVVDQAGNLVRKPVRLHWRRPGIGDTSLNMTWWTPPLMKVSFDPEFPKEYCAEGEDGSAFSQWVLLDSPAGENQPVTLRLGDGVGLVASVIPAFEESSLLGYKLRLIPKSELEHVRTMSSQELRRFFSPGLKRDVHLRGLRLVAPVSKAGTYALIRLVPLEHLGELQVLADSLLLFSGTTSRQIKIPIPDGNEVARVQVLDHLGNAVENCKISPATSDVDGLRIAEVWGYLGYREGTHWYKRVPSDDSPLDISKLRVTAWSESGAFNNPDSTVVLEKNLIQIRLFAPTTVEIRLERPFPVEPTQIEFDVGRIERSSSGYSISGGKVGRFTTDGRALVEGLRRGGFVIKFKLNRTEIFVHEGTLREGENVVSLALSQLYTLEILAPNVEDGKRFWLDLRVPAGELKPKSRVITVKDGKASANYLKPAIYRLREIGGSYVQELELTGDLTFTLTRD